MKIWFTREFLKASAVLLVVFTAGAGTGYIGGRKYAEYRLLKDTRAFSAREARSRRGKYGRRFMRRLERDLNLNPGQRESVNRTLQRHHARIREIRNRMAPQMKAIMREVRKDVRSLLDDDQKVSFDRIVKTFEERRKRRWRKSGRRHSGAPADRTEKP